MISTNSYLSSIPLYCMGFYYLPEGVHKKMDGVRATFLWQGTENKLRYHMAKWEMVSRPKDQGGLGIINTMIMNECLLVKWIWKIHQEPDQLWFKIIKAKYLDGCSFFASKSKGGSQFWQGLHKVKHLFKWGALFSIGNGLNCRFWQDCWLHSVPLKISYEMLYKMARDSECYVADCWTGENWFVEFKRPLSVWEYQKWEELLEELSSVSLQSNKSDESVWALTRTRQYSTKSLYRFITDRGFPSRVAGYIWKSRTPLKIKFFLWQVFNNKLQVALSLSKRGGKGVTNAGFVAKSNLLIIFSSIAPLLDSFGGLWGRCCIYRKYPDL